MFEDKDIRVLFDKKNCFQQKNYIKIVFKSVFFCKGIRMSLIRVNVNDIKVTPETREMLGSMIPTREMSDLDETE